MTVVTTVLHPENDPAIDLHPETDAGQVTDFLNKTYPVGTVYMSIQSTSPASLFGGTWTAITNGFLASAGYSGITAGSTGGHKSVVLLRRNMPRECYFTYQNNSGEDKSIPGGAYKSVAFTATAGSNALVQTSYGVAAFNNPDVISDDPVDILNPYYGVYMWRRVA